MRVLSNEKGYSVKPGGLSIWQTVQGEGFLAGSPTVFVRLHGCPVVCKWCDTQYTGKFVDMTPLEVAEECIQYNAQHVCITGGEPIVPRNFAEIERLCALLHEQHRHITIETSGVYIPPITLSDSVDFWSVSPKMPSAGATLKHALGEIRDWFICLIQSGKLFQIKVVVKDRTDYNAAFALFRDLGVPVVGRCNIVFQPEAGTHKAFYQDLFSWVQDDFAIPNLRILPQLHKMLGMP